MHAPAPILRCAAVLILALVCGSSGCQSPADGHGHPRAGHPFDEQVDGRDLVEAALARARAEDKRVLLLFGANWCPYCRQLHALLAGDPEVGSVVREAFVVVPLDVGTSARNRNTGLIDRYDAGVFTDGVPALVVLDARGRKLAPTPANPWSARERTEAARVLRFLRQSGA